MKHQKITKAAVSTASQVDTLEQLLCATSVGGSITLEVPPADKARIARTYAKAISHLDDFDFWRRSKSGVYRPAHGLWLPQRRAIAFAHGYLSACATAGPDVRPQAALVKMPTGTGKTSVIAALACVSPLVRRTLIITPRAGLVHQLRQDLSWRLWGRAFGAVYHDHQLHEGVDESEIDRIRTEVKRGAITPIRALGADQYKRIWEERNGERQILVSTFNALHLILGLTPPAHRSMWGRKERDVAKSLLHLNKDDEKATDTKLTDASVEGFRELLRNVDLVIVDEGHYEPAYSWAQAVRHLGRPTIVFSATPYRNDYKYFDIDGNFVFNLSFLEAASERLVRDVSIEAPLPTQPPQSRRRRQVRKQDEHPEHFVAEFQATLAALPTGKKAIVHAANYQALTGLQRAFHQAGESVVVIHDSFKGAKRDCHDLKHLKRASQETLKSLRFQHVHQAVESATAREARVWLHQFKLLEGIDDSSFLEIWLYDGLASARHLVQQVGRAIRRPDLADPHGQVAVVRGSSRQLDTYEDAPTVAEQVQTRWRDYLAYETYTKEQPGLAFRAETQLLASVKRAAPAVQYIAGEFRGGHLLDESPSMAAFLLPRRATICRVLGLTDHRPGAIADDFLDDLQESAVEAMRLEERFDISPVPAPLQSGYEDMRLIRYLAWNNSPYLARHHVPEWRLGVMAIARAGRYIFLLDTEGICVDTGQLGLATPEPEELKRLFPDQESTTRETQTRIVETAAAGLDISELGLRSISVRRHALDEGYFDLAEGSQVPTSVRGYGRLGNGTARRRLSFSTSSVSDVSYQMLGVKHYLRWVHEIANAIADPATPPHRYFGRFALDVPPLSAEAAAPISILLDLWDLLEDSSEILTERQWKPTAVSDLLQQDTCCTVETVIETNEKGEQSKPRYFFQFAGHRLEITYRYRDSVPPSGRYSISSETLDHTLSTALPDTSDREDDPDNRIFGQRQSASLIRLINQNQSFRIIPSADGTVYSHAHFHRPDLDKAMLDMLESSELLADVLSEKGDTRIEKDTDWNTKTLFGLIYGWLDASSPVEEGLVDELIGCSLAICDDSNRETADFYVLDEKARQVIIIHAKADTGPASASPRKLQEVTRQAQTSLAFAGSGRRKLPYPSEWNRDWSVKLKAAGDTQISRPRLTRGDGITIQDAHKRLNAAFADPTYAKDVVMLTSGMLSKAAAYEAYEQKDQADLQFLYFLASVRTSFNRAGVRYRIVCNP